VQCARQASWQAALRQHRAHTGPFQPVQCAGWFQMRYTAADKRPLRNFGQARRYHAR